MNSLMRHTAFLSIGEELRVLAPRLKQYLLMYGASDAVDYLHVLSCVHSANGYELSEYVLDKPQNETIFSSGIENRFRIGLSHDETVSDSEVVQQYFTDFFNRTVVIENPGETGTLNVCLCVPLSDVEIWEDAKYIIQEIVNTGKPCNIDVLGLAPSMSHYIRNEGASQIEKTKKNSSTKKGTSEIAKDIIGNPNIHRLIVIEDNNSKGLSLNIDTESLVRILGEYLLLAVEHYPSLFPITQIASEIDVTTFGLSMLAFDKIYFVEYLLHRAYLDILGKEKVTQKNVNVNQASEWAASQLDKHVRLYSDFMNNRVIPLLNQRHKSGDLSVADTQMLETELRETLQRTINELQSFINDESRSLPEKQAIMALLLGEDDALLEGELYRKNQLTIDDCDKETLEYYINEDNKQVQVIEATESTPRKVIRGVLTAPVDASERVYLPLESMKLLRAQIRQRTSYIRKKTEELQSIQEQLKDEVKRKTQFEEGGFSFDGTVYKLMPKDKEIRLFEHYYAPKVNSEKDVDLRNHFTAIKNQGELGACSAFALVSIFEQIMKKANPSNPDLSERYAYYNALRKAGASEDEIEDVGSSFYDVVSALTEDGLCSESLCPYKETIEKPSEEAYGEGKSRLVKEAVNVEINHESLTSALAEGYPVAISLKIYESFNPGKNGFVFRPSEDEINSEEGGNHAMVLCGYNDDSKVYIVRNSWGVNFGDKGYCYIPFSYVDDPQLNNQACIITDVEVTEQVKIVGVEKKKAVSFNLTDDNIRASILRILIGEEEVHLKREEKEYAGLRFSYEQLLQTLSNPSKRDEIYANSVRLIDQQIDAAKEEYEEFVKTTRPKAIDDYKSKTLKNLIVLIVSSVVSLSISAYFLYLELFKIGGVSMLVSVLILFLTIAYVFVRKHRIKLQKNELAEDASKISQKVASLEQEKQEKHLRMHLAGCVISNLTDIKLKLIKKYQSLTDYVSGLSKWCDEEQDKLVNMEPPAKTPCIQMLDNAILDKYFEQNKARITKGFHLSDLVESYHMTDDDILEFKLKIRDELIARIQSEYQDFSMFSFLSGRGEFDYLPKASDMSNLMTTIDKRSDCFLQIEQTGVSIEDTLEKSIYIHTDSQADRNEWREMHRKYFSVQPGDLELCSKYKLIEIQIQNLSLNQVSVLR
ncbi:MAG: C1 family peptidase [Bacteroidales bacterium]|nr:C1 family peptidase [Bacteroidales bacterium]